jgi:hypothetical protein
MSEENGRVGEFPTLPFFFGVSGEGSRLDLFRFVSFRFVSFFNPVSGIYVHAGLEASPARQLPFIIYISPLGACRVGSWGRHPAYLSRSIPFLQFPPPLTPNPSPTRGEGRILFFIFPPSPFMANGAGGEGVKIFAKMGCSLSLLLKGDEFPRPLCYDWRDLDCSAVLGYCLRQARQLVGWVPEERTLQGSTEVWVGWKKSGRN